MTVTAQSSAEQKLDRAYQRVAVARAELDAALARKLILCHRCGKRTRVDKLVYLQTRYYIEPYSCTGGDYWRDGEGGFDCPKCGEHNRLYKRPAIVALKRFFARVEEVYNR